MTDKNEKESFVSDLLSDDPQQLLSVIEQSNKLARQRNRLAKRQHQQSMLDFEQAQRQYLIEKAHLQPSFRMTVTEFLTCEPSSMSDPEQAGEAKYLSDRGIGIDTLVLRFRLDVKGDSEYMRPYLVLHRPSDTGSDQRACSMSELLYFTTLESVGDGLVKAQEKHSFYVYFVYRDKTTLPVVHKYRVSQLQNSGLRRWEVEHVDTAYAKSHKNLARFYSSQGCDKLFSDRDQT